MLEDPIVTAVRQAGKALEEEAQGDLHRFFQHLRDAQAKYKERLVKQVPHPAPAIQTEDR